MSDFEKGKQFIQNYFNNITKASADQLEQFLTDCAKDYSSISELLNTVKEGKGKLGIHFAAARGDLNIFKYLVSKGADIKQLDEEGNSPFFVAVQHGHKEIAQYLLDELNQSVDEDRKSITALHLAAQLGNIPIIELLLSHGADINKMSNYGTPLTFAVALNQTWCCELLLKKGANVNLCGDQMPPILHLVADTNNMELFDLIVTQADLEKRDPAGWSLLHVCAEKGREEMIKKLLELNVNVDYENEGMTALDLAVQNNQDKCFDILRKSALRKEPKPKIIVSELSEEEIDKQLEIVLELKKKGNEAFQKQNLEEARQLYEQALKSSEGWQTKKSSQIVPIYTNLAQVLIKLKLAKETLEILKQAKVIDATWVKIYYFEGQAFEVLGEYGEAAASYFDGMKQNKEQQMFKKMFDEAIKRGKELHNQKKNQQN